ncbi:general substrate transporter [Boletus coccyginus]|nr:general substrate transporter [Boletus coccyginus]
MDSRRRGRGSYAQLDSNDAIVSRLAQLDQVPWYSKPNLRLLYFLMAPTCLGVQMTSGFDASMVNGLQAVSSWLEYYDYPRSASLGLMVAIYSVGSVSAAPFVPFVVDKMGRRFSIFLGGLISIVGGILQGSSLNFLMFIVARFILGFADVFCIVAASSLIGELSYPKERAVMCSLFNDSFDLGAVVAASVTLGTFAMTSNWGWRIPSFFQIVPSLLQVSFIWFLPESPRWLISTERGDEAYAILVKYHAEGDETSEFVKAEYTQIEETLEAELRISHMSQRAVFSMPGMRKRVIIASFLGLFISWSGVGLISYFLSPILDSIGIHDNRTKNIINLAKHSWSLVNCTFSALIAPRYPRRRIYLASAISLFVVFTAWTIASAEYSFTHNKVSAQAVLVQVFNLIFLYSPAYNLAFSALTYTYLVELFPFHARATGITIYQWWGRVAAFVNQFVNPIGIDAAGWRWYIVYCVWNAFQVVFIYFVFPETSGRTLEELAFLFEGDQEVFRHGGAETLCEGGEIGTYYGALEDSSRRTVRGDQG